MNEVRYNLPKVAKQDPFDAIAMIDYWMDRIYYRTWMTYVEMKELFDDCHIQWQGVNWKGETGVSIRNMLLDARSMHMRGEY